MASSKVRKYEENNWACIVICLKRAANVLKNTIEKTLREEIDRWDSDTRDDFKGFTESLKSGMTSVDYISFQERKNRNIDDAWEISGYTRYKAILKKILSMHTNPRNKNIQWNSDWENSHSEPFWILAKMFMPQGNKYVSTPFDADPISLFDLVKNCELFKDLFSLAVIEELCKARNAVMHSCDQKLTSEEKDQYIKTIETFLTSPCFKEIPEIAEAKRILSAVKSKYIHLEQVDIKKLEEEVSQMFPEKKFHREELLEDTRTLYQNYVSSGIKNLKKELEISKTKLKSQELEVYTYKQIGGVAGASVLGTTGLAAAGCIATVVGAPVTVPAFVCGGVAAGIGYMTGRAGGAVIGWFQKIT